MHSSAWRGAVDSSMGISSGTRMEQGGGGHLGSGAGAKRRVGWQEGRVEQAQGQADAGAHSSGVRQGSGGGAGAPKRKLLGFR